jgi:hypothetical protein
MPGFLPRMRPDGPRQALDRYAAREDPFGGTKTCALVAQPLGQVNAEPGSRVPSRARDLAVPPRYTVRVNALRRILLAHRRSAAWLIAVALLMRILIPTGYMLAVSAAGTPTFAMCSGYGPMLPVTPTHSMGHGEAGEHAAMQSHGDKPDQQHDAAKELPCAFTGIAAASLAATDPLLLAIALFFILAAAFRLPVRLPAAASPFLRPPLRGPPATA